MADAALLYARGILEVARLDVETADLRVLLVQPTYRYSRAHVVVDDETPASPRAHELTVSGYVRQALTGRRLIDDPVADGVYLEALDLVFGELEPGERVGGAVLFREAGSDQLSPLLAFYGLGRQGTTGGAVIVAWAPPDQGRVLRLLPHAVAGGL